MRFEKYSFHRLLTTATQTAVAAVQQNAEQKSGTARDRATLYGPAPGRVSVARRASFHPPSLVLSSNYLSIQPKYTQRKMRVMFNFNSTVRNHRKSTIPMGYRNSCVRSRKDMERYPRCVMYV